MATDGAEHVFVQLKSQSGRAEEGV
jgi:hypothetical protein